MRLPEAAVGMVKASSHDSLEAIHVVLKEDRNNVGSGISTSSVPGHGGQVLSLQDFGTKKCFVALNPLQESRCSHHCSAKVLLAGPW